MAIFYSTIPNLSTSMRVNGAIYRIKFIPRDKPYCNGILAIGDLTLCNALRKHPYFGTVITEFKEEVSVQIEEKKEYVASYPNVIKAQEAKEILVREYHISADTLTSKSVVKKVAEEYNVAFPNL